MLAISLIFDAMMVNGRKIRTDSDPFETCVRCSWDRLQDLHCRDFRAYACKDCGLFWWEKEPGMLTCDSGLEIMVPLTNNKDPFS